MKNITIFYLFLYVTHVLFGPYYFWYIFTDTPFRWRTKNLNELLHRILWITYVGFLSVALFNEYPNAETFIVAFTISLFATIGYFHKFDKSEEYFKGSVDHLLILMAPLIYLFFHYNINLDTYKPTYLTYLTILYLFAMKYSDTVLYKSGIDI